MEPKQTSTGGKRIAWTKLMKLNTATRDALPCDFLQPATDHALPQSAAISDFDFTSSILNELSALPYVIDKHTFREI